MQARVLNSLPTLCRLLLVQVAAVGLHQAAACTTLAVGRQASADGSVFLSHSDDAETNGDARLCYVPAADHAPGTQRPIYFAVEDYPRYVGTDRGSCYQPQPGQAPYEPIGWIPEVAHTFAYFEATYGIVNEHGLGIGETTCSGIYGTSAIGHGGKALLSIDTLSHIAMERTTAAREAVKLMGSLAEEHGFYGAGSFEGSAESLMVGDPLEVFIFHILPDPTGTSAIWAAQRVPDDHVAVVANMFVIRDVNFSDPVNFLFSESVRSVAQEHGWWRAGQPLDFTKIYSDGEYAHKFYSGRRVWGAYRKFGVDLPDNYTDLRVDAVYPPTARAPSAVHVGDLFAIHRDYYEGTKFDMTKGLAAGPWGDPDRWTTASKEVNGNWERSIGLFRTTTTHVVQCKTTGQGSLVWFGPHTTAATCFVPVFASATEVPAPYNVSDPNKLSKDSAYWAHRFVFNVAKIKYAYAMEDVKKIQSQFEADGVSLVKLLDAMPLSSAPFDAAKVLNKALATHADQVLNAFWSLPETIVEKYADGWLEDKTALGYPDWWLKAVGYQDGPPPPPPQPSQKAEMSKEPQSCNDDAVHRCVSACHSQGFARCAAECVKGCDEEGELVI
mmetsp:Transcript_94465/g.244409  ORF Transcript_94465/g.244409 Transcript_94465/m.244409 type:complete len:611 (-) Transcript_94465:350-2182(-)